MREIIKTKDLKVGMYIVLPARWMNHPFLTNQFVIKSDDQIKKITEYGFEEIAIDTAKGAAPVKAAPEQKSIKDEFMVPPIPWEPEKLVPPELREAIRDKTLAPEKKSRIVYESSIKLMGNLLKDPKVENIKEAKKGIAEVVDLIISDDATSSHLLKITAYDYYTYTHSVNVGVLSVLLSKSLFRKSYAHDMHELGAGFFLHDIGKVRVDPAIINKPGRLTDEEMRIIRQHPTLGYELLSETNQLTEECKIIVMQHHERENGIGYPKGLRGTDIHMYGRICCIADVYDALTSERSYKLRMNTFNSLKLMKEEMLHHFQKDIFEKFVLLFT